MCKETYTQQLNILYIFSSYIFSRCIEVFIMGIKHDFLCINICRASREILKPEPKRRGFQPLPRGPVDVNVSEKHVWSLLLHRIMF